MIFRVGYWVDHIVYNMEEILAKYKKYFNMAPAHRWRVADVGLDAAMLPCGASPGGFSVGGGAVEVLAPIGGKFMPEFEEILEKRGEGYGMVTIHFSDYEKEVARWKELGVPVKEQFTGGHPDAWLTEESTYGLLIEVGGGGGTIESYFSMGFLKNTIDPETLPKKGMIVRMGNLVHAVKSLDAALAMYEKVFRVKPTHRWELPDADINAGWVPFGDRGIQVVEARSPNSYVAKAIEERGEGIVSVVIMTDDTPAMAESLKSKGVDVKETMMGGNPCIWVPRELMNGMLYQIVSARDYYKLFKWGELER
jgi:hypothetical protein